MNDSLLSILFQPLGVKPRVFRAMYVDAAGDGYSRDMRTIGAPLNEEADTTIVDTLVGSAPEGYTLCLVMELPPDYANRALPGSDDPQKLMERSRPIYVDDSWLKAETPAPRQKKKRRE